MTTAHRVIWRLLAALVLVAGAPPAHAEDDAEAPAIEHTEVKSGLLGQPLSVAATLRDPSGIFDPAILYRVGGEGPFLRLPMQPTGAEDGYEAVIPATLVSGDVEYFIEVFDQRGNGPARYADEDLPVKVPVLRTATIESPPLDEEDEGGLVWVIAGVVGGGLLLAAAGAATVAAVVLLSPPAVPSQVDVVLTAPSPVALEAAP